MRVLCCKWLICIIGSHDCCHAPLGVSSFSFAIQNIWGTACPPPIILRLFITDTISSATICRQYTKILRMRQKKLYSHNCGTKARLTKHRLTRLILEDDVPRASLHSRTLPVHKLKVLLRNYDYLSPTLKF